MITGPFNVLTTRVSAPIPHGMPASIKRPMFSAIVLNTVPVAAGSDERFPNGMNFAVTIYLDAQNPATIRIGVTLLASPVRVPLQQNVVVRWFAVSP